ncbi:hypothetical protein HOY80DRAFT_990305 [Tuber brumale]|nr:hypothetical protein HOY80DRAFT_990305 [Tuber brumale]
MASLYLDVNGLDGGSFFLFRLADCYSSTFVTFYFFTFSFPGVLVRLVPYVLLAVLHSYYSLIFAPSFSGWWCIVRPITSNR